MFRSEAHWRSKSRPLTACNAPNDGDNVGRDTFEEMTSFRRSVQTRANIIAKSKVSKLTQGLMIS
jgi:hypothetical protein